ncbi:MAG: NADH dehydrogenase FAD-containing subunit [Acidobacteria bacterium]|nr:MAG: NADH dehydrogenase FAD-containing subunit [Acidobacteriota bacterium]
MLLALILLPAVAGAAAFFIPSTAFRRGLLVFVAFVHAGLTGVAWFREPAAALSGWLRLDDSGLLFLSITSGLFLAAAVYALGYLAAESKDEMTDLEEHFLFRNAPEAGFVGCLLLFLAAMTLVTVSRHLGLLWIAIEATTLFSAPLIYFHRHHRSLEATWKYLLICSVGIALALLGTFFVGVAAVSGGGARSSLVIDELLQTANSLNPMWLRAAFALMLVGYGTKMGLAPLHTWLPDAHSESPSLVSALLSGALLNCAFLGILRMQQICTAGGQGEFSQKVLLALGLLSVVVAAVFVVGQTDFKRLLAYSSVEHMGLLAIGVGLGPAGVFGAFFHALNHSVAKAMLFLLAGNVLSRYGTKSIVQVRGLVRAAPGTGLLWVAGFLAITGTPPFGLFFSKFLILKAAFDGGHWLVGVMLLVLLAVIFIAMATACLGMAQGIPDSKQPRPGPGHGWLTVVPSAALAAVALAFGIGIPPGLAHVLSAAAQAVGGVIL